VIITLVFEKNANFFCRKLSKIVENCDHNIDPWTFLVVALIWQRMALEEAFLKTISCMFLEYCAQVHGYSLLENINHPSYFSYSLTISQCVEMPCALPNFEALFSDVHTWIPQG
jgi:hypothetical protein